MLEPILKNEGVNASEKQLSKLLNTTFLSLWSYIGPYSDEGAAKNKQGKEMCDALVVFGNKVIIFSDKEIKFNEEKSLEVAWKRWYTKSITDSVRQLHAAESWVKNNPHRIFLDNFCTIPFPIDLNNKNLEIHLVALTKNTLVPAQKYFDTYQEGSSGTFIHFYPLEESECLKKPFILCDVNKSKTFVHIFDEFSIDLVINELGTISDFLNYLKTKENLIRKYNLLNVLGEEDLLGYYLDNEKFSYGVNTFEYPKEDNQVLVISEGYWNSYKKFDYKTHQSIKEMGAYWNKLVANISDGIITAKVGEGKDSPFFMHERAARALATENRSSRAYLSQAFLDKIQNVPNNRRSSRILQSPLNKSKFYILVILPFLESENLEDYSQKRPVVAWQYSLALKYRQSKAKEIVVIIMQPQESEIQSEAIFTYDYSKPLDYKDKILAKKIIKDHSILSEFTDYSDSSKDHNAKLKVKWGRNDKCHCGSALKYKKCCLYKDELTHSRCT